MTEFNKGAARAVKAFEVADGAMDKTMQLPSPSFPGGVYVNIATTGHVHPRLGPGQGHGPVDRSLDPELATQLLAFAQGFLSDSLRGPEGTAPFGAPVATPPGASPADELAAFQGRQA